MNPLVEKALQEQLTLERTNSAVYRSLADELDNAGWGGMAKFMRKSSDDETSHGDRIAGILVDRNITPIYDALPAMTLVNNLPPFYFHVAYDAEVRTTGAVCNLYALAQDEGEYLVSEAMHFFLDEQRKSEREVWDIVQALEATDEWRLIDQQLGE